MFICLFTNKNTGNFVTLVCKCVVYLNGVCVYAGLKALKLVPSILYFVCCFKVFTSVPVFLLFIAALNTRLIENQTMQVLV